ncbi:hypothetical protein P5V15_001473 [Pogonomyrmex californicus]
MNFLYFWKKHFVIPSCQNLFAKSIPFFFNSSLEFFIHRIDTLLILYSSASRIIFSPPFNRFKIVKQSSIIFRPLLFYNLHIINFNPSARSRKLANEMIELLHVEVLWNALIFEFNRGAEGGESGAPDSHRQSDDTPETIFLSETAVREKQPRNLSRAHRVIRSPVDGTGDALTAPPRIVDSIIIHIYYNHCRTPSQTSIKELLLLQPLSLSLFHLAVRLRNYPCAEVGELAFHNSTQLQSIDLSGNVLETLNERTMDGLLRLEFLDLHNNRLVSLPETLFDSSRVHAIEKIDLSNNHFNEIPNPTLQRQSASLFSLKLARNRIVEVFTQDIINNVKELDLSENRLSENAIRGILGEAKILRSLNLANTNIKIIPRLEMPFLKHLNLSGNAIADIKPIILERTTMLESLDVSRNHLTALTNLVSTFKNLPVLLSLDISNNEIKNINESNFDGLATLHSLKMENLLNCTRIERNTFRALTKLRYLYAYNYPKLGYFDVQGILKGMINLEILDIEIKDASISNEQLSVRIHPYLRELTLRGERLRNILSSSLVGVRGPQLFLNLKDTSIDSIPTALFFPVPRSTKVELNVSGSKFTNLSLQLLTALDERGGSITISGLDKNPINCNCEAKHLWKWLKMWGTKAPTVTCASPNHLVGILLINITEEYFLCDRTTPTKSQTTETIMLTKSTIQEPEIIWTIAPTMQNNQNEHNNDHTGIQRGF